MAPIAYPSNFQRTRPEPALKTTTPLAAFLHWESTTPDRPFLRQPVDGVWLEFSYRETGRMVKRLASFLKRRLPGKSNIAILSKNCAEWIITDLAIMMADHVSVPIYPTLSAEGIKPLLEHGEVKMIVVGKLDSFDKQHAAIPLALPVISFDRYGIREGVPFSEIIQDPNEMSFDIPSADELATVMYSSGTTGTPKGVMLTHGAFGFVGDRISAHLSITEPERFFSYLPLSHIAERSLMEMAAIASGSCISFVESLDRFNENLVHEKPTIFGGVPRIYSKFREGVLQKMPQKKLDMLTNIPLLGKFVKRSIARKLGLSEARVIVSGAAPTPVALLEWFAKLGIDVREMYGMTENAAFSHANIRQNKIGTVGQAWPEVECKFSEDGEILIRHEALMKGYFKDEEATAKAFTEDGFLKTGDRGFNDSDGFLQITGRVKDQFKSEKGKFISPGPIELTLLSNPMIEQACVVGTGLPQPIGLVVLNTIHNHKPPAEIAKVLEDTLTELNKSLEGYERLKKLVIIKENWTIENGMLTPSLKLKRQEVEKKYSHLYEK